eukprot:5528451-Amphidinium_carterae.1
MHAKSRSGFMDHRASMHSVRHVGQEAVGTFKCHQELRECFTRDSVRRRGDGNVKTSSVRRT